MDYKSPEIFRLSECRLDIHDSAFIADTASVVGNVRIGMNASVWFGAVLRGDMCPIVIGDNTNIQDNTVIHVDWDMPAIISPNVSVGHSVVIHGAKIGSNCIIGMHSTVLSGAEIGENCIIAAGAVVMQGQKVPANSIVMGIPAQVKKQVDAKTLEHITKNWQIYCEYAKEFRQSVYHKTLK